MIHTEITEYEDIAHLTVHVCKRLSLAYTTESVDSIPFLPYTEYIYRCDVITKNPLYQWKLKVHIVEWVKVYVYAHGLVSIVTVYYAYKGAYRVVSKQ